MKKLLIGSAVYFSIIGATTTTTNKLSKEDISKAIWYLTKLKSKIKQKGNIYGKRSTVWYDTPHLRRDR